MTPKGRITRLEQALAPILARRNQPLTAAELTDQELAFLIRQQYPNVDLDDDEALLAVIAAEKSKHEAIGPKAN